MKKAVAGLCLSLALLACSETKETEKARLAGGPNTPQYVRLSWNDDPATTAAVVWHTDNKVAGAGVEYGESASYGKFVAAESYQIETFDGWFHRATLTGLTPGTTVHYRVGSTSGLGAGASFMTAPAGDEPFSFVIEGDSRHEYEGIGAGYPELIKTLGEEAPAFILDSGDYTFSSQSKEWVAWLKAGEPLNPFTPRLTTFGNHEMIEKNYFSLVDLPLENEEKWYSLDYGPLHIVCLYTGFGSVDTRTRTWLEKDLAASKAKWKVAFFHMPPYNAGHHGDKDIRLEVREQWVPLFEKYGVDVVAGGHDHNYQNFGFIKAGVAVGDRTPPLEGAGEAPLYIVSGGAGAPLYDTDATMPDIPLLVKSEKAENYVLASVDGDTLTLEVKRLDGTVIDTITITK